MIGHASSKNRSVLITYNTYIIAYIIAYIS